MQDLKKRKEVVVGVSNHKKEPPPKVEGFAKTPVDQVGACEVENDHEGPEVNKLLAKAVKAQTKIEITRKIPGKKLSERVCVKDIDKILKKYI